MELVMCDRLKCRMRAEVCVARRNAASKDRSVSARLMSAKIERAACVACVGCAQGAERVRHAVP